ncbi:MAG: hypothetical protein KA715_08240 [Xanthomonadaceae bacterium]|nr:hypothetical protein [Xanthomonadaceae bacterium]
MIARLVFLALLLIGSQSQAASDGDLESIEAIPGLPKYALLRPLWGVQIGGGALHGQTSTGSLLGKPLTLQIEIQPTFMQSLGVLSFGPMAASFFSASTFYGGGMVKYQARFFHEQWIVPVVGYEFLSPVGISFAPESMTFGGTTVAGGTPTSGLVVGGWFLLNIIERSAASQFFTNHGVLRSYLTAEYRSWWNGALSFWHFGLRIEY